MSRDNACYQFYKNTPDGCDILLSISLYHRRVACVSVFDGWDIILNLAEVALGQQEDHLDGDLFPPSCTLSVSSYLLIPSEPP